MIADLLESIYFIPLNSVLACWIVLLLLNYIGGELFVFKKRNKEKAHITEIEKVPIWKKLTVKELQKYDGSDETKPILVGLSGIIYDVTRGKQFYGKDGPYNIFAGKDCTKAFALESFDSSMFDHEGAFKEEDLNPLEKSNLQEWISKFEFKYRKAGEIVRGK